MCNITNKSNDKPIKELNETRKPQPGEGIRSMRSSYAFRLINYELYAKPSKCEY